MAHDHTYYGNGCPNTWDSSKEEEGYGGSAVACETRILKTYDDESLKNGTYYVFAASTAGSGSTIETDNTNSPDTFCPLGWQMPYGGTAGDYYDKSKSLVYLFNSYHLNNSESGSRAMRSYPISYIFNGFLYWNVGRLFAQDVHGYYVYSTNRSPGSVYRYRIYPSSFNFASTDGKLDGGAVRCFYIFSTLSSTARWKELM